MTRISTKGGEISSDVTWEAIPNNNLAKGVTYVQRDAKDLLGRHIVDVWVGFPLYDFRDEYSRASAEEIHGGAGVLHLQLDLRTVADKHSRLLYLF